MILPNISQVPKRKENLALQSEEAPPNCNLRVVLMCWGRGGAMIFSFDKSTSLEGGLEKKT